MHPVRLERSCSSPCAARPAHLENSRARSPASAPKRWNRVFKAFGIPVRSRCDRTSCRSDCPAGEWLLHFLDLI